MTSAKVRTVLLILAGALIYPVLHIGYVWAQPEVLMTGQDSSGNTRIVRTDTSGQVINAPSDVHR